MPEANRELFKANGRAHRDYKPCVYSRKIILLKTTRGQRYAPYMRNPEMCWRKLAGGVETIMIEGDHDELLRSDRQVALVAQHLKEHLAA